MKYAWNDPDLLTMLIFRRAKNSGITLVSAFARLPVIIFIRCSNIDLPPGLSCQLHLWHGPKCNCGILGQSEFSTGPFSMLDVSVVECITSYQCESARVNPLQFKFCHKTVLEIFSNFMQPESWVGDIRGPVQRFFYAPILSGT